MTVRNIINAVILSVGDELVLGQVVDTNAAYLSVRLVENGVLPVYHQTAPDDLQAITEAVKSAAGKAELVIVSGGLGPTADDLTRQAMAQAAGVPLVFHGPSLAAIKLLFRQHGWTMSKNNRVQAMFPAGAAILANPSGTAPGFKIRLGKAAVVVVPGVPREMEAMFARHIAPLLAVKGGNKVLTARVNVFGLGESLVAEKLGELMRRDRNPLVGTTVAGGVISIRVRGEFAAGKKGPRAMQATVAEIKQRLGAAVFGEGDLGLAGVVGGMLLAARKTLVTAESCTAGVLAAMLTEMPGASKYYLGGWVVYSNALKTASLAVPAGLILQEGAVSAAVAGRMAKEALRKSGADYALAITGIAGPGGGSAQKKVGTVWIALARETSGGTDVCAEKFLFPGERALVRERAAKTALNILRLRLMRPDSYMAAKRLRDS